MFSGAEAWPQSHGCDTETLPGLDQALHESLPWETAWSWGGEGDLAYLSSSAECLIVVGLQVHLNIGLNKIRETEEQVKELQKSLTLKSRELEEKKTAANLKLKEMLADQQKVLL